jgi:hypothetical protein
VLGAMVAGNSLALVMVWPLIPASYSLSLAPVLWETLASGATMAIVSLPLAIILLWLSRKYGSHSAVTERRLRVIHALMRRRSLRNHTTPVASRSATPDG